MKKGMERKIPLGMLLMASVMTLFLIITSSGQVPCGEGDLSCDQGWDLQMDDVGASMLASSLNSNLAYDINSIGTVDIAFDFKDLPSSAAAKNIVTGNDTAANIRLTPRDIDKLLLIYEVISPPKHGTLTGQAPNLIYTPEQGYTGDDSVVLSVSDGMGEMGTISIDIGVIELYHPPSVRIRSPLNGEIFTIYAEETEAWVPVSASATGSMSSGEMYLFEGPNEIDHLGCSGSEAFCSVTFNEKFSPGLHTLIAQATDDQGYTCSSPPVTIIVNPPEPIVEITSPNEGQIFTDPKSITIEAYINDSKPLVAVEVFANSKKIGDILNGPPYSFVWDNVSPGVYNLAIKAKDQNNTAISKSVLIVILSPDALAKCDLDITMSTSSEPAPADGLMNYFLTVTNRGPDGATDVTVQDYLPPEMTYVSSEATQGSYASGVWSVGDMAKYSSARLVITVHTATEVPPRQIANTAYVFGAERDPYNYNNHATVYTTLAKRSDLASLVPDAAAAGSQAQLDGSKEDETGLFQPSTPESKVSVYPG
jgi:uncharacterized repeat protein (TIGR01451 family)